MATTDAELYRAWADGDREAGSELIERHLGSMARFFVNKVADRDEADELVAETFARVAQSLGKFAGRSSFRTYLFGVARHLLLDHLRGKNRGQVVDPDETSLVDLGPSPSGQLARKREHHLLLQALRAIPLASQIVLELTYFEGLTRDQVAEILDCPPGTAASRLRHAREQLEAAVDQAASSPAELRSTTAALDEWAAQVAAAVPKTPA